MENNTTGCKVVVKPDGVYLVVDTPSGAKKVTFDGLVQLVDSYGVNDVNTLALKEAAASTEEHIDIKISQNRHLSRTQEKVNFVISSDNMEVVAWFEPPDNNGLKLTMQDIRDGLIQQGIVFGILEDTIFDLSMNHLYGKPYVVAKGLAPQGSKDGVLTYHFNKDKKATPTIREDGSVDFHDLNLLELVEKGQLLISRTEPQMGKNGMNVFGTLIPGIMGKPAPPLPKGRYLIESDDGKYLYAGISGRITTNGAKVTVSPVLELKGDIDNATGNVVFNGSVVIRGVIRTGFKVKATGNIECYGVVEGAQVESDGDIFIYNGLQGGGMAQIKAGGDITLRYATRCTLEAGGDIVADCILHSDVSCGGTIEMQGKNRIIIGGKVRAGKKLVARSIGSTMSTATDIEIGFDPDQLGDYREAMTEYNAARKEYQSVDRMVAAMSDPKVLPKLDEAKKNLLLKNILAKKVLRGKIDELQKRLDVIAPQVEKASAGVVVVQDVVYAGVKVMIGNSIMYINDNISNCVLRNTDGRIVIDRYV